MHSENQTLLLDKHYQTIEKIILSRQDPITGLLPASTAITAHGDYTDAWVRDNVYSILAVWGLALSYRKHAPEDYRTFTLSQSVVKLMRGLLCAMMRQSDRVERFKATLQPTDSLHAKYGTSSGLAVVGDDEWGHLQLDATSLYLLMLAQMIASGLKIIYSVDEVNFIQNLVHYISHTYCTPDYGIWERGNKINHGTTEINCSSVGMAKAALEAMSGFNLFGDIQSQEGVIHVIPSDIARSRFTLHGLLPRESNSKETDAALLSIIGYPAYAVEDVALVDKTRNKIIEKLAGQYGCKRFLLDGHQSSIEDSTRLHYEPSELYEFADIESEWPLFFTYFLLDALMRNRAQEALYWREKLEPLFVEHDSNRLLPELYIVPVELIEAEKENPGSQIRIPNENIPLVWAQSLFILSDLIQDKLLEPQDIDPLNRHKRIGFKPNVKPLVTFIAENEAVKTTLQSHGIVSQTLEDLSPIRVMHASELSKIHTQLGVNTKLSLSGRPLIAARTITTARLHMIEGKEVIFLPYYFNPKGFYFSYDHTLLVKRFRSSLKFLANHWDQQGEPLLPFLIRSEMLEDAQSSVIYDLLHDLQNQICNGIEINVGPIKHLRAEVSIERIDNLNPSGLNALELEVLDGHSSHLEYSDTLEYQYESASKRQDWYNTRRLAESLGKFDDRLEDALLDIIIHQKRLAVGRAYSDKATFSKPFKNSDIIEIINESCGANTAEAVLTQEIMIHLGQLIQSDPALFSNMLTLRTWYFVQLLVGQIIRERSLSIADAYEHLISLPPHDILERIQAILKSFSLEVSQLKSQENLNSSGMMVLESIQLDAVQEYSRYHDDWVEWRVLEGMISRVSPEFYHDVWHLLRQCNGLVIGDKYNLESRIGSEITLDSTPGEQSFAHRVDDLLQRIDSPEYRQLNIEAIQSLSRIFKQMPNLRVQSDLVLDVIIGHAVRIGWKQTHPYEENYDDARASAWEDMYAYPPIKTAELFFEAFMYLLSPQ